MACYCLLSRKIFFLLFNILNSYINPFPDALCCRNIYLFSSEIYKRKMHKRAYFNKTRKTKQLLTLGLTLMSTLQVEGLFRSLKLTFMSILSSGPSAWNHGASFGLQVLFCKYQFFSKLGKFLRKKNKT